VGVAVLLHGASVRGLEVGVGWWKMFAGVWQTSFICRSCVGSVGLVLVHHVGWSWGGGQVVGGGHGGEVGGGGGRWE